MSRLKGHEFGLWQHLVNSYFSPLVWLGTHLPLISFSLSSGNLDLQILLRLLSPVNFLDQLLFKLLARSMEFIEFGASFCEHVGHFIVLCFPVGGTRRVAARLDVVSTRWHLRH